MGVDNILPVTVGSWNYTLNQFKESSSTTERNFTSICLHKAKRASKIALMSLVVVVQAVVSPLLIAFDVIAYSVQRCRSLLQSGTKGLDGGCDAFFSDNLWGSYIQKLNDFSSSQLVDLHELERLVNESCDEDVSPLTQHTISLIRLISDSSSKVNGTKSNQSYFRDITQEFRNAAQLISDVEINSISDREALFYLRDLAMYRYLDVNLDVNLRQSLENINSDFVLSEADFMRNHESISKNTKCVGPRKELFDAHLYGNIPFTLHSFNYSGKNCQFIRMPSVTKDLSRNTFGQTTEAKIIEEFLLFLDVYKKTGKTHVYFNLMDRTKKNEKVRSIEIEKMDEEFSTAISVTTIDQDSSFYINGGNFRSEEVPADEFIEEFDKHLFHSNSYYWSSKLDLANTQAIFLSFLHIIHQDYFQGKEYLTKEERCQFIELQHLHIIDYILETLQPDSSNISCKHCIDRGATQNGTYYAFRKKREGQKFGEEEISHLNTMTFAPAYLVSNRPPFKKRVYRKWNSFMRDYLLND